MKCLISAVLCLGGALSAQETGWVVIPTADYESLRARAYPVRPETATPSADAVLTRVDYDLRLDASLATGRAAITVDVLKDGWVRIPIPAGLLVGEARLGGSLVSLVPTPGRPGQLSAILQRKGRSVLQLEVAFPVTSAAGEEKLALPAGTSGVTRAEIAGPPPDTDLKISGGFAAEKSAARWIAYARGAEPLAFAWHRQVEERHEALRLRGKLTQLYGLGEDSTTLHGEVEIEVVQGAAAQVKLAVPAAVTINQVPGATVADWDVQSGQLTVTFLEPVEHSARFAISGETHLPRDGSIDLPLLRLLDVERESGGIAVEVTGAGEIKQAHPQGLDSAHPAALGDMVAARQSPSLAAFRLRPAAATRALNLQVVRYAQQAMLTAIIEEARYRVLLSAEGKTLIEARYAVRNNQRSFVRIALPPGATLWSAALSGRPVRPGKSPDGSLLFPLAKGRAGEDAPLFPIELLYFVRANAWTEKGRAGLALPLVDLPISRTGLLLYYPPLYRVTAEPGAFRKQDFEQPQSPVLSGAPPPAEIRPALATTNDATQALVDHYNARPDARAAASAPIRVSFPAVGPSIYLASELTGESKSTIVDLSYSREKKAGVK